jgi:hypothetical protein
LSVSAAGDMQIFIMTDYEFLSRKSQHLFLKYFNTW